MDNTEVAIRALELLISRLKRNELEVIKVEASKDYDVGPLTDNGARSHIFTGEHRFFLHTRETR